jgi:hypothetical protein
MSGTKAKWPLFLLAWLSFIPIFGFFIGSAAAGWGLVSSRPRALVAAGIGAGGALLNLIGLIALGVMTLGGNRPEIIEARRIATERGLVEVVAGLEAYRRREGAYPASLGVFTERVDFRHPINPIDPSGGFFPPRLFEYHPAKDRQTYQLFSVGPDTRPGTPDDIYPELPDSLRQQSGLRNKSP